VDFGGARLVADSQRRLITNEHRLAAPRAPLARVRKSGRLTVGAVVPALGLGAARFIAAGPRLLTLTEQRAPYVRQIARAVRPGGRPIVATFGPEGPQKCSGLDVVRYGAERLHGEFGSAPLADVREGGHEPASAIERRHGGDAV